MAAGQARHNHGDQRKRSSGGSCTSVSLGYGRMAVDAVVMGLGRFGGGVGGRGEFAGGRPAGAGDRLGRRSGPASRRYQAPGDLRAASAVDLRATSKKILPKPSWSSPTPPSPNLGTTPTSRLLGRPTPPSPPKSHARWVNSLIARPLPSPGAQAKHHHRHDPRGVGRGGDPSHTRWQLG